MRWWSKPWCSPRGRSQWNDLQPHKPTSANNNKQWLKLYWQKGKDKGDGVERIVAKKLYVKVFLIKFVCYVARVVCEWQSFCLCLERFCVRATELIRVVYEISEAGGQEGGQEGERAGDRRADGSAQQGNKWTLHTVVGSAYKSHTSPAKARWTSPSATPPPEKYSQYHQVQACLACHQSEPGVLSATATTKPI